MAAEFQVYTSNQRVVKEITARIYLKDPLVEKAFPHIGKIDVKIKGESCIGAGPTSSRVAVVDYNGDLDTVFAAARLHSDKNRFKIRGGKLENDFHFHQVNVWATIHRVLGDCTEHL